MKKLVAALCITTLLTGCSYFKKSGDSDATAQTGALNDWDNADITNLSDTRLGDAFKAEVPQIIYFKFNAASLASDSLNTLDAQVAWLKAHPNAMILVEGHCDERGTVEYNLALGDRRAVSVRDYMILNGIDAARIRTISYGKERPDVLGADEATWAKNRRAVTIVN